MKRKIMWQRIAWIAGGALVIYLVIGVIWAGFGPMPPPSVDQPITLKGGTVQGHHITTKSWTFDYQSAQLSPDGSIGTVYGVKHGILYRKGKPYMSISAEQVSLNTQTLDFTAIGKVHVERIHDADKHTFDTDLVEWTNGAKSLSMPHPSYFGSDGRTLKIATISVDFVKDSVHLGKISGAVDIRK